MRRNHPTPRFGFRVRGQPGVEAVIAISILALVAALPAAATEGPFYKVSGTYGTAYLLGSLHFGTESMYPLSPRVEAAFEDAERLAVEIDVTTIDPVAMAQGISSRGSYADGTTLEDHLSPPLWRTLERRAAEYELPLELISYQRPWLAAFTIMSIALTEKGYHQELGVDRYFLSRAQGRMPIVELEGFELQLTLLSDLSFEQQEYFLASTLDDLETGGKTFERIIGAWKRGDADSLDREINASWQSDDNGRALYERLVERRNSVMIEKIAELLEAGSAIFVVVGAAHIVGEGGLARRLEAKGFEVEKK